MKRNRLWNKVRSISDPMLNAALTNHAQVLTGVAKATNMLLRERRLLLLLHLVEAAAITWLILR